MKGKGFIVLTVINLLILLISVLCLIGTAVNNEKINAIGKNFTYREEGETVILKLKNGKETTMQFGKESVKVWKSYEASEKDSSVEIVSFIRWYANLKGYEVKRENTELIGEYRLHNALYRLGYKREQTGDSDLDYEKDKRWYVTEISKIIGWCGF